MRLKAWCDRGQLFVFWFFFLLMMLSWWRRRRFFASNKKHCRSCDNFVILHPFWALLPFCPSIRKILSSNVPGFIWSGGRSCNAGTHLSNKSLTQTPPLSRGSVILRWKKLPSPFGLKNSVCCLLTTLPVTNVEGCLFGIYINDLRTKWRIGKSAETQRSDDWDTHPFQVIQAFRDLDLIPKTVGKGHVFTTQPFPQKGHVKSPSFTGWVFSFDVDRLNVETLFREGV